MDKDASVDKLHEIERELISGAGVTAPWVGAFARDLCRKTAYGSRIDWSRRDFEAEPAKPPEPVPGP